MSLILDALRRAERARDKDLTRRISESGAPRLRPERRSRLPVIVLGIASAVVALLLWPRPAPDADPPATVETSADASPQAALQLPATTNARGSSLADIDIPETPTETTTPGPQAPMFSDLPAAQRAAIPAVSVDAHF